MKDSGTLLVAAAIVVVACGGRSERHDTNAESDHGSGDETGGAGNAPSGGVSGTGAAPGGIGPTPGGAGGGPATGGLGGAGDGGRAGAPMRVCGALIDDMEDGTGRICLGEGRRGVWYAYNDGHGVQWPAPATPGAPIPSSLIPNGRDGSLRAMYSVHTYAEVVQGDWGAGIALDFAFDGARYGVYDASAYDGITFWTKSNTHANVGLRVSTVETTLVAYGGTCPAEFCNPHAFHFTAYPDWIQHSVPFTALYPPKPDGFVPGPFRKSELTNLQFLFVEHPNLGTTEIWIDDVSFYTGTPPSGF